MEGIFDKWDPLLQIVAEKCPLFLTTLTEEMVNVLCSPNSNTPYCEGIYMWLDYLINSNTWKANREHLSSSYLRAACEVSETEWTKRLRQSLQKSSHDPDTHGIESFPEDHPASNADIISDQDETKRTLSSHGWEVMDTWRSEAIGVV